MSDPINEAERFFGGGNVVPITTTTEIDGITYHHTVPRINKLRSLPMGSPLGGSHRCRVQPLMDFKQDLPDSEENSNHEDCICGFSRSLDTSGDRFAFKHSKIVCVECFTKTGTSMYYAIFPGKLKCGHESYVEALQEYIDNLPERAYAVGIYSTDTGG